MLQRCKTAGITLLVSADVPDATSSRHCSERGHIEGASFWEWNTFSIPGRAHLKSNPPRLEVHTQTDRQTDLLSAAPLSVGTVLFSPMSRQEWPFYSSQDAVTQPLCRETATLQSTQ